MEVRNLTDLAKLLSRRDGISMNEAWNTIEECQQELNDMFCRDEPSLMEAENIIADYLSLEPDYLDLFFM